MEQIEHKYVEAKGLKFHIAETGKGSSVVVFLHGFPEIWYSWRHQMVAVANAGFKAIAPDFRGYGLSEPSVEPEKTNFSDFISDLLAILDAMGISKVFLVGKDFGSLIAYSFAQRHQMRVSGVLTLGVPFMPPGPFLFLKLLPEGFYILRWREPGRAETDFGRFHTKTVVRNIYILFSQSEIPIANENQEIMDLVEPSTPLPHWMTEDDLTAYATLYEQSGFQTALQVPYRSLGENPISEDKVEIPAMLIMGEKDYLFKFPGTEDFIRSGNVKFYVPKLEIKYIPEGSHFVQEQFPDLVNELLLSFLSSQSQS